MIRSVVLGAPSPEGEGANAAIAANFGEAKFPLRIVVKNHMPRDVSFPEVPGLFLRHVGADAGTERQVVVVDQATLHRLASSIEQVATLNNYAKAVVIKAELPDVEVPPAADAAVAAPDAGEPEDSADAGGKEATAPEGKAAKAKTGTKSAGA